VRSPTTPPPSSAHVPEDWPHAFTHHLKSGNVDGVLALYAANASMLNPQTGELVTGHADLRVVFERLVRSKSRLEGEVVKSITTGDVAVLYTDFQGTLPGADGKLVPVHQRAIEVLRRQPDGTWKLVFGDPAGRGEKPSAP
jgi:ketosteroid isomerase-like protein